MRRPGPTSQARKDRWKREDEAPRLKELTPKLRSLKFQLEEFANGRPILGTGRVRHIPVDQASQLFEIPCTDPRCDDGGYDVTRQVMQGLRETQSQFEGADTCDGYVGDRPCGRVLKFVVLADFDE